MSLIIYFFVFPSVPLENGRKYKPEGKEASALIWPPTACIQFWIKGILFMSKSKWENWWFLSSWRWRWKFISDSRNETFWKHFKILSILTAVSVRWLGYGPSAACTLSSFIHDSYTVEITHLQVQLKPLAYCWHKVPAHAADEISLKLVFFVKFKNLCKGVWVNSQVHGIKFRSLLSTLPCRR